MEEEEEEEEEEGVPDRDRDRDRDREIFWWSCCSLVPRCGWTGTWWGRIWGGF